MIHSKKHQLYHLATFKTKITTKIANICRVLFAKYCSKALYLLLQLILSNNFMTHTIISPILQKKKLGHREVK